MHQSSGLKRRFCVISKLKKSLSNKYTLNTQPKCATTFEHRDTHQIFYETNLTQIVN